MANTSSITDIRVELASVLVRAADLLAMVDPDELATSLVPGLLEQWVMLERIGSCGRVLLTAKAVEAERWKREGFASPSDWLGTKTGCGAGRVKQDLETSKRLKRCRGTADALRDAALSPEQAGAIADAATLNPDAEADLLEHAQRESLKHLKDEAARRKAEGEDLEEKAKRIHRERSARSWVGRDGCWIFQARGPIAAGSGFEVDLARFTTAEFEQARREQRREGHDQYAFDALMAMGRAAGNDRPTASRGAERDAPANPKLPKAENLRHLALIRIDLDTLLRGSIDDGDTCEIHGVPVAVSTIRDLLGDSIAKLVITRGVDVLHVTHLGRGVTVAQQVALLWSQTQCSVERCNRTVRLENDHGVTWADEQVTELHNQRRLCTHHHDLKTLDGWDLIDGVGRRPMVPPEHPDHPRNRGGP